MVATALKEKRNTSGTIVDLVADLTSTVLALVTRALKDESDTRRTGRGTRSLVRKSVAPVPSGTNRALPSGVEMRAAPCTTKE
jgi:hypothetical protein